MRPDREEEFTQYVGARIPRLHRIAYQLLGDRDRADDAVQNALTVLYQRWSRMQDVQNLDAYVHTMVVRACLDDKRRWWSRVHLWSSTPDVPAAPDDPQVDQRMMLRAALRSLPEGQRTVLVLRFLCDLPVAEVAQLLHRSEGTVKSQTSNGLRALRKILDAQPVASARPGRMA
ncbi:SigE family RNA polymerase sigma factor [Dactylosporangium fulvum]|uniref:SigE family RNA polymerase sigma factor n=1 Tax=Dactylosporangium fulvum TaxID=53359 RepID=A0ABY5VZ89_9ACTN|nr:SigE family RNA polymerase sigma factor [Dactylosporangium fulvum]UWP83058.1 SigE family RNA polymerase sigma factor [Dactylosporangium fulvum]